MPSLTGNRPLSDTLGFAFWILVSPDQLGRTLQGPGSSPAAYGTGDNASKPVRCCGRGSANVTGGGPAPADDSNPSFTCTCKAGFSGPNCEWAGCVEAVRDTPYSAYYLQATPCVCGKRSQMFAMDGLASHTHEGATPEAPRIRWTRGQRSTSSDLVFDVVNSDKQSLSGAVRSGKQVVLRRSHNDDGSARHNTGFDWAAMEPWAFRKGAAVPGEFLRTFEPDAGFFESSNGT
jgi:hypothetical protein